LERPLGAGLSPSRPLSAWFHGPEGRVPLQETSGVAGFLSGSLGPLSVEEVFAHVLSGIRSGWLAVQHCTVRRTVSFREAGGLRHVHGAQGAAGRGAASPGALTQAQLTQALSRVTPSWRRIRQVLISEGLVSEANLYGAMTYVVREVVLSLFGLMEGSFLFIEGPAPMADEVRLPERTRELGRAHRHQAGGGGVPSAPPLPGGHAREPGPEGALPGEERLSMRLGTGATLGALRATYEGGHSAFYTWLEEALRGGNLAVRAVEPPPAPGPRGEGLAWAQLCAEERYNQRLSLIHQALRDAGRDEELLHGFLDAPSPGLEGAFAGVTAGPDGRVAVARLSANLASGGEAVGRALTLEVLDAIVS